MTKLEGPLRRELAIGKEPYTLTITPEGLKLVPKGRRKGYELSWRAFIDGDAALAVALNASLASGPPSRVPAKQLAPTKKTRITTARASAAQPDSTPGAGGKGDIRAGKRTRRNKGETPR